jgi:polysaccharide chain length determinant protein (PEP-CTERM system associated)
MGIMQASQEPLTTQRRELDVEDYIDIVRRHKGWIVGPAFAALVVAVVGAFLWPDTYVSESLIQVVPPQIPERYVISNVNSEMTQRINSMAQTIESRANLTNIINTYTLYPNDMKRKPLEDVIEGMKKAIKISPVASIQTPSGRTPVSAFRVSFEYSNRYAAQKVARDLVSRFIDENIRTLASQSAATTDFLTEQWQAAKKTLDELENRVTEFRLKNAGRLPDQLQANLQTLQSLETQLAGINDTISRIGQEKLLLESQIRVYRDQAVQMSRGTDQVSTAARSERIQGLDRQIMTMESAIASLKERYKESHPDLRAAEAQLRQLRERRSGLLNDEAQRKEPEAPARLTSAELTGARQIETSIAGLESQIQARNLDLEARTKTQKLLTEAIDQYNARIQASPVMERDYVELTRDHNLAKMRYEELNAKRSQSAIATDLEKRQIGERLELLDAAYLPEAPVKPNRLMIIGAGLAVGLMLGVFVAGGREMKDTSLKSLKDARAYTGLQVLGTVPLLENDLVVRRKRRLSWLAWSAACILGVLAMTSSIYYYYTSRM